MFNKIAKLSLFFALCLIIYTSFAYAQDQADTGMGTLVKPLIGTIIFGVVGLVFLVIGYLVFNLVTPYNINKEIAENKNVSAGIVVAGVLIALALIITRAISL